MTGATGERWRRVDAVLAAALERPDTERAAFLNRACDGDAELRSEVASLLARDVEDGFLESPAAAEAARAVIDRERGSATPGFAPGQVLGNRFRVLESLGSGGVGEVWRALDLKLRVDVALKAVRSSLLQSPEAADSLRREVRAAREVVSPNVCRVFDLVELDGRELVSMEYVDGTSLAEVLVGRSPLAADEAQRIAAQLLAGLEAIHAAGLVHRDIKPENVMLTRSGRVVLMDFGIAAATVLDRPGESSGTPAYMAPEQFRGERLDARADVFSAGLVLAEMVAPHGAPDSEWRRAVRDGARREPPEVGETPWAPVLRKVLARAREERYPSAAAVARALEETTRLLAGEEEASPYPGLASFTAAGAPFFFGRELEIEEMWRRLRRLHLLALIGPSGAGKSSFLRAGLLPMAPPGWRTLVAQPGDRPIAALARAVAAALGAEAGAEAAGAVPDLLDDSVAVELVGRWRRGAAEALLVVDQFEELFTQSPPEVREPFARLLARLALELDVHVLLSMRDDFLLDCHALPCLAPIFSELTPIRTPTGAALRRALVQPALKCGYRFEDDAVIDAMIADVEGERAALPLVAFAAARLWDRRDRERGLLTGAAFHEIGGVAGALAQHAEGTLERIGRERIPLARELLRNLVTAQGTRATATREELLSAFDERNGGDAPGGPSPRRQEAAVVLDALVDARLLTTYELPDGDQAPAGSQRVEVIHESLLSSWPRLARWRAQDEEGSLLRDQLRLTARLWEERGRPEDLLWTGTSLREYQLWRERYPGGLSSGEERFAAAMAARALKQRRRRRVALAAVLLTALVVASALGVLWRRSEGARAEAVAATRRTEAQQLFALGRLELERNPTGAFAYALASVEREDSQQGRHLALGALWRGPIAFELSTEDASQTPRALAFSPDGQWLVAARSRNEPGDPHSVRLWRHDGTPPRALQVSQGTRFLGSLDFSADSAVLAFMGTDAVTLYGLPTLAPIRRIEGSFLWGVTRRQALVTYGPNEPKSDGRQVITKWLLPAGEVLTSDTWSVPMGTGMVFDPGGDFMFQMLDGDVYEAPLGRPQESRRRVLHDTGRIYDLVASDDGQRLYTLDDEGTGRVWSRATGALLPGPRMQVPYDMGAASFKISANGGTLVRANGNDQWIYVWDLEGPVDVDPLVLSRDATARRIALDATGSWLAAQEDAAVSLWPLTQRQAQVLRGPGNAITDVAIDPGGEWIAGAVGRPRTEVWLWPLRAKDGRPRRVLDAGAPPWQIAVSPDGLHLAAGTQAGIWLIPLDGGRPERLPGFDGLSRAIAFDGEGRRLAAGGGLSFLFRNSGEAVIRIWDLETGAVEVLDAGDEKGIYFLQFLADGRLVSSGHGGVRLWDRAGSSSRVLIETASYATASPDGRHLLGIDDHARSGGLVGQAFVYSLNEDSLTRLPAHGREVTFAVWDASGRRVVTGSRDGTVRVGPATGEEPHLLFGHQGPIWGLEVAASGDWLASASEDGTIRLWAMPEGRPLHTLPHEELLVRLRSLTNVRAVADPAIAQGFRLAAEPFGGWRGEPPSW